MKVTAYVTKPVPVEVEIDDRWKPMEFFTDNQDWSSNEAQAYFDENVDAFETDVIRALDESNEPSWNLGAVHTAAGNYIFEN